MSATAFIILLLVVPMIGLPILFNWIAASIERRIEDSRTWPSVEGEIVRSKSYQSKGVWYPSIVYTYTAQGVQRRASRFCFGGFNGAKAEVQAVLDRFPLGARVPVYYDPAKPKSAVLERSGQAKGFRVAGWVLAAIMFAILVVVLIALPR